MACLCSPTTHAGSFRCRLHRTKQTQWAGRSNSVPESPHESQSPHPPAEENLSETTLISRSAVNPPDQKSMSRPISTVAPSSASVVSQPGMTGTLIKQFPQRTSSLPNASQHSCKYAAAGPSRLSRVAIAACADDLGQQGPQTVPPKESTFIDVVAPRVDRLPQNCLHHGRSAARLPGTFGVATRKANPGTMMSQTLIRDGTDLTSTFNKHQHPTLPSCRIVSGYGGSLMKSSVH